jgi:O-antigen/teichoic acid export membrane protein
MLLLAALVALLPFGLRFFRTQLAALHGNPNRYWPIFRDVTRWSLSGVVLTELTVNAHAYFVTFICGPGAFALLALGMLLMRPASLMQSALPDLERPAMARAIAADDSVALSRIQRQFTFGLSAAWLANIALCAALLAFMPALVVKQSYGMENVIAVASICALIMTVRALRTPPAVLLQAAGRFKELAGIGASSAAVSCAATLALLLLAGPIASMGGILLGELVILAGCYSGVRNWKLAHA